MTYLGAGYETSTSMCASVSEAVCRTIDEHKDELFGLSDGIWKVPELCFKEFKAHQLLTDYLEKKGFAVERSYTGLETAFRATFGSGRPNICVICEYDALPDIGHACGHNLIAEAGVAAGLGLKAALEASQGGIKGRVTVLGTPAEEGGGGKVMLIENGAFNDVDVAMMVHPAPLSAVFHPFLAMRAYQVTYTGRAAHAAAFPWEGVNALDAAVTAYNSISVLRQQMKPACKVHGVIKEGGVKPNIIPEKAVIEYYVRAPTRTERDDLAKKVVACFEAAAVATGCGVKVEEPEKPYDDVVTNRALGKCYEKNMTKVLGSIQWDKDGSKAGSTDMGNVSYKVPSIHVMYSIGSAANHTRDFTTSCNTLDAHHATLQFAKGLALTGLDVLTDPGLLDDICSGFKSDVSQK